MLRIPDEVTKILVKAGVDERWLHKIRFGGVVGKMALVAITAIIAFVVVAFKADTHMLLWGCLVGIFLIALLTISAMWVHAHKHPVEATLEGAEVVALHHLQHEYAAKGMGDVPSSPPVLEGIGRKAIEGGKEGETT